jgi:tyrosyl-tRNA synthetase
MNTNINDKISDKYNLITNNIAEIIGSKDLLNKLEKDEPISFYWGTAPTGKIHIGYLLPMIKITEMIRAGCSGKILFADLHAYLDAMKTSWSLLNLRSEYYEHMIKQLLHIFNVDLSKIEFVKGSSYQLTPEYTIDVYKMLSKITVDSAQKGGAEVVKQSDNPLMSGLIYPILQILDEAYLKTDIELGGIDQRKIFMMSRDHLHKLGYKPTIHLMNRMLPSLGAKKTNEKMSSSEINTKIELTDTQKEIKKKINKTFLEENNIDCPLFEFIKYVIFPILELKQIDTFVINRDEKWGGPLYYKDYDTLTSEYLLNKLSPPDVKLGVIDFLTELLDPLRVYFETSIMIELVNKAYP